MRFFSPNLPNFRRAFRRRVERSTTPLPPPIVPPSALWTSNTKTTPSPTEPNRFRVLIQSMANWIKSIEMSRFRGVFAWKKLWVTVGAVAFAGLVFVGGVFAYFAKDLPSPDKVRDRFVAESTKIFDRSGSHLLYEVHGEEKRTVIPFADMPDVLKYATIALEDQDFYHHFGLKLTSILRAVFKDIVTLDTAQGGSTITQQLVKNTLLTREQTFTRKIKEAILSIELETKYTKDEILEMYLNQIPYGSNAYGIEAAARTFFDKSARELSLDEAALLSALPQAPTYFSPYGSRTERLIARKDYALQQMASLGYISEEAAENAIATKTLEKIRPQRDIIAAPHFVMYIKEYLQERYGDQAVEQGGLKVITTLDWDKQQVAEQVVREGAEKNKRWRAANAALVALDPKTGQILSMVGSKDYFQKSEPEGCTTGKNCVFEPNFNVSIAKRQPGSSFKPYVYLTAFTKGYLPETLLYDVETQFETTEGKSYEPKNYDGKFRGPLAMKEALAQSLNVPAVKTLYLVGVPESIAVAKNLGITGLDSPERLGLSLVLGGGEVRLLDHVHAYGTLATGGVKHALSAILRIEDPKGTVLEEFQSSAGERVIEEKFVSILDHVMSTNDYRAPAFGKDNPLRFDNRPVAAKTGTTNEFRDGWTIGFTPSIAVGVWAGNNDNSPMAQGADGVNVAAPIWRNFLNQVLGNYAVEEFPKYTPEEGVDKPMLSGKLEDKEDLKVCEIPGEDDKYCLANKYCRDKDVEKKDFVVPHDILYYVDRQDPRGPIPEKPSNDPQYKNWEKGVKEWYKKQKGVVAEEAPDDECKAEDFKEYRPKLSLNVPGSVSTSTLSIEAIIDAPYGVKKVDFVIGGSVVGTRTEKPYSIQYSIPSEKNNTTLSVTAVVEDKNGNQASASKDVSVGF